MGDFRERIVRDLPGLKRAFLGDDGKVVGPGLGSSERNYVAVWIERDGPTVSTYYEVFRLRRDESLRLSEDDFVRATITAGFTEVKNEDDADIAHEVAERFLTLRGLI